MEDFSMIKKDYQYIIWLILFIGGIVMISNSLEYEIGQFHLKGHM